MYNIAGLQGMQYPREGDAFQAKDYAYFNQQYASSSYQKEHDMNPALIVQPKDDDDVVRAVRWAREQKVAVAVKSGGHQYSGASSTGGKNIQIDLTNTYKDMKVLPSQNLPEDRALVFVGVSNQLQDFNAYLKHNELFVPHGQCAYVCVGGHGQTGGYGQLGRSFGLFGDHIVGIRMVDYNGDVKEVTEQSDSELFNAIRGGSPGNFGIITHYVVNVYQAKSYIGQVAGPNGIKGPYGLKGIWLYHGSILKKILTILAKMSDNPDLPGNFDLCISVLSTEFPITMLFPSMKDDTLWQKIQERIKSVLASEVLDLLNGSFPAVIVVYAQWCPTSKSDRYDETVDNWFKQFWDLRKDHYYLHIDDFGRDSPVDMATMTGKWIFPKKREFDLPYVKRTWATNSRTLSTNGWVDDVVKRLDLVLDPQQKLGDDKTDLERDIYDHCKLSVQIQAFGGEKSKYFINRNNGASYSWRDSTIVQVIDCFHDENGRKFADNWQTHNDQVMVGPASNFSKVDKRMLWGSHGDWDLSNPEVWKTYYEDEDKYRKIGRVRGRNDPNGTFTANPFAVKAVKAAKL
ncbi:FAD-binding domain-containing protein, partial [Aureobasidium melanogenum]